jgi:coenzyme F420-0:L-glutamate ligase / coenzyme F420-1:gamma-L-glutamate ligase
MSSITITPVTGIPDVKAGDDVAALIVAAAGEDAFHDDDVVVVAQKAISKSEGRVVPAADRREAAQAESVRVLRRAGEMIISETRHGLVCANAGVDASNVEPGSVVLLPIDPDLSARRVRARIAHLTGRDVAVIVSDTFGRAWRLGQTNVAIGVAGMDSFVDYRGKTDSFGNELTATRICIADELAGAAEVVMGKSSGICAAVVSGAPIGRGTDSAASIVRPPGEDMFR